MTNDEKWWKMMENDEKWWKMMKNDDPWTEKRRDWIHSRVGNKQLFRGHRKVLGTEVASWFKEAMEPSQFMPIHHQCQTINVNPGLINHGLLTSIPPIVIIWYLNGTFPIK